MTINKLQGQSLRYVGLDLRKPMFTHSQLYVALFCATNMANLTILLPESAEGKTDNVVFPEVLQHLQLNAGNAETDSHVQI